MVVDIMSGSTIFSSLDLTDGFYQIVMRPEDVPLTAVSTPSDALSRRPDNDPRDDTPAVATTDADDDDCIACATLGTNITVVSAVNPLRDDIAEVYSRDVFYSPIVRYCSDPSNEALRSLSASTRAHTVRYSFDGKLLMF
ncbi:unnamed protein product [Peronospora farinosa]|uniref:Reverse transcriptase domain-containing protein n=1 Tax=Peronospora farinosa TaxID=134698 RepID=A0AAV0T883_9STRA|nr:unnamed protein product [Peronospora farinosa]